MSTVIVRREDGAEQVRIMRDAVVQTVTGTTTDSFVDAGTAMDAATYESFAATIKNTGGSNGLSWQIVASIDGTNYVEIVASANVASGAIGTPYAVSQAPYRYYKAQVKAQSAGNQTTFSVSYITK